MNIGDKAWLPADSKVKRETPCLSQARQRAADSSSTQRKRSTYPAFAGLAALVQNLVEQGVPGIRARDRVSALSPLPKRGDLAQPENVMSWGY